MGKPPRERLRIPEAPSASRTSDEHAGSHDRDRNNSCNSGTGGFGCAGIVLNSGPVLSVNNIFLAISTVDGCPHSFRTSADALDSLHSDLFRSLLPGFTSLEFGDGLSSNMETGPISTLGSPELEGYSTPAAQTEASQPAGSKGHDCFREAYDILGSLSFYSLNNAHSMSQLSPGSASTTASTANQVSLDYVLRLNREASERLGRLLTYSCARSPHLVLLYASIISQVLI